MFGQVSDLYSPPIGEGYQIRNMFFYACCLSNDRSQFFEVVQNSCPYHSYLRRFRHRIDVSSIYLQNLDC